MKWMMLCVLTLAALTKSSLYRALYVEYSQNQAQEYIGRNLHLAQGVDEWVALVAPEIPLVAWYEAIEVE